MKKLAGVCLGIAGVFCILFGGISKAKLEKGTSISIIGGADGPTSVFLAGKTGDGFSIGLLVAGLLAIAAAVVLVLKKKK